MNALERLSPADGTTVGDRLRVAAADGVVLVALIVAGELRHQVNPVEQPLAVVETAVPFLVGWAVVGTLVGAYGERALADRLWSARIAVGGWLGAVAIGAILRGSPYFAGAIPWTFLAVMAGFGTVALVLVRVAAVTLLASTR
ncbi:DUF3054 domain-containing protein [Haloarchaeobius sp. FL176]|uniref:DUF3054 domain-containing protein n=1 Tax=Haloarchaeobius sp. FL176 TaxID=2967129 RepID=UPI0021494987|nr:DUF3054 domain-containing protein [Haloarchaeobius sp. FL176]